MPTVGGVRLTIGSERGRCERSHLFEIPEGEADVVGIVLVLQSCGDVTGTLLCDGEPLVGGLVSIGDPELGVADSGPDGRFLVQQIPAGRTSIYIAKPDGVFRQYSETITVEGSTSTHVVIDVPRDAP